jgi:hypothetical protein
LRKQLCGVKFVNMECYTAQKYKVKFVWLNTPAILFPPPVLHCKN